MHMNELRQHIQPSGTEWAFTWFIRILALVALASGVFYWVRLIGIHPGLLWRFDLMPWTWQTAVVALAVLMPVAATGLWMRAPWGPVLWFVAALGEIAIYSVFRDISSTSRSRSGSTRPASSYLSHFAFCSSLRRNGRPARACRYRFYSGCVPS